MPTSTWLSAVVRRAAFDIQLDISSLYAVLRRVETHLSKANPVAHAGPRFTLNVNQVSNIRGTGAARCCTAVSLRYPAGHQLAMYCFTACRDSLVHGKPRGPRWSQIYSGFRWRSGDIHQLDHYQIVRRICQPWGFPALGWTLIESQRVG